MIDKIKENNEKISLLVELYEDLEKNMSSKDDDETIRLKMSVAKEEILKSTFEIKRALTQLEANIN